MAKIQKNTPAVFDEIEDDVVATESFSDEATTASSDTLVDAKMTINLKTNNLEKRRKGLAKHYKAEGNVSVAISPQYKPWFGSNALVSVNGISVSIPCNGRNFMVPKAHAAQILGTIHKVDANVNKANNLSNLQSNEDNVGAPGTLKMS